MEEEDEEIQKTTIFRGRLKECIAHLFSEIENQAPKGTREAAALRRPIAEFCAVKESSVARWMRGGSGAIGEVSFRLNCYLQLCGYEVIEVVRSDPTIRGTIELIGFRVMTGEEIADQIGYTTSSTLFQALNGRVGLGEEKKNALWGLVKKHRGVLEEAKKKARATINSTPRRQQDYEPGDVPAPNTVGQRRIEEGVGSPPVGTSQGIIGVMAGLLILLEKGILTEENCAVLTPHEQRTVLQLSGHLSRLSSSLITRRTDRSNER